MPSLTDAVRNAMAGSDDVSCNVDGHDFNIERVGRSKLQGVVPRTIQVDGKIVHDYDFPQSDDDIFFQLHVTEDERAVVKSLNVEGGLWSFDDVINAVTGLPGILAGGIAGAPLTIGLKIAIGGAQGWEGAMVKVLQAVGQQVWDEYFA